MPWSPCSIKYTLHKGTEGVIGNLHELYVGPKNNRYIGVV